MTQFNFIRFTKFSLIKLPQMYLRKSIEYSFESAVLKLECKPK